MGEDVVDTDVQKKLERLADANIGFVEKLQIAATLDLDYWDNREVPPNLSVHVFKTLIRQIPVGVKVRFEPRKSISGPHGKTGDDNVFIFEFLSVKLSKKKNYFVKGYFFDKGNCKGVCIQSFREEKVSALRVIRN
jgi:hypothetical protein